MLITSKKGVRGNKKHRTALTRPYCFTEGPFVTLNYTMDERRFVMKLSKERALALSEELFEELRILDMREKSIAREQALLAVANA